MRALRLLLAAWLWALPSAMSALSSAGAATPTPKVLRIASESETGFDPARVGDARSFRVIAHIFEPLLRYDPLARPVKLRPGTAVAMPEPSADFRTWTVRVRPGIFFTDDPAFGGRPRELVAADYAYSIRRLADPASKSPGWSSIEQAGISGLAALRRVEPAQHIGGQALGRRGGLDALGHHEILAKDVRQPDPGLQLHAFHHLPGQRVHSVGDHHRPLEQHRLERGGTAGDERHVARRQRLMGAAVEQLDRHTRCVACREGLDHRAQAGRHWQQEPQVGPASSQHSRGLEEGRGDVLDLRAPAARQQGHHRLRHIQAQRRACRRGAADRRT